MKSNEELKNAPNLLIIHTAEDGGMGVLFKLGKQYGSVIWSTGGGWDHVSVSPFKHSHTPTWDEMCALKDMFFREDYGRRKERRQRQGGRDEPRIYRDPQKNNGIGGKKKMSPCREMMPEEMRPTELMTVNASHYFCLLEKSWQYDLLSNLLWRYAELSPNERDLSFSLDLEVELQWYLKTYKGFDYQVAVDKMKDAKAREKKWKLLKSRASRGSETCRPVRL